MATDLERSTTAAHLNDLYWNSDKTIDEIVAEQGIGRNTLYSAIEPLPAGETCDRCDGALLYANRSRRSAGVKRCAECGAETDASHPHTRHRPPEERARALSRWQSEVVTVPRRRAAMIGGAAALGAFMGAAAVRTLHD